MQNLLHSSGPRKSLVTVFTILAIFLLGLAPCRSATKCCKFECIPVHAFRENTTSPKYYKWYKVLNGQEAQEFAAVGQIASPPNPSLPIKRDMSWTTYMIEIHWKSYEGGSELCPYPPGGDCMPSGADWVHMWTVSGDVIESGTINHRGGCSDGSVYCEYPSCTP